MQRAAWALGRETLDTEWSRRYNLDSRNSRPLDGRSDIKLGVSAQKVEVFKKGSRADFLHYTASIVMVDHGSTRNTPRR